jgi:uncharacterized protein (TIGR02246 family)
MDDPVQEQLDAYNAHDVERFLACYAEDVVMENATGDLLLAGRDAMRATYAALFERTPRLHAEVPTRIRAGEFVVDEEIVTGLGPDGSLSIHSAVVYRVRGGLIVHVRVLS